jgi:hypothetical protein
MRVETCVLLLKTRDVRQQSHTPFAVLRLFVYELMLARSSHCQGHLSLPDNFKIKHLKPKCHFQYVKIRQEVPSGGRCSGRLRLEFLRE